MWLEYDWCGFNFVFADGMSLTSALKDISCEYVLYMYILYIWTVYIDGLSPGANTVLFWAIVMVITNNHIYTDSHAKGYIPINGCGGSPLQIIHFRGFTCIMLNTL